MNKYKISILTPHPVQYKAPFFRKISENEKLDLKVYFKSKKGIDKPSYDEEFSQEIKWDIPLLQGYSYEFLTSKLLFLSKFRKNNPDALLVYGWNSFVNWLVIFLLNFINIKILLIGESPLNQELKKSRWKLSIKKFLLGKILFPRISAFLYIGEQNKEFYIYYGVPEGKLFFTPYSVDNKRFQKSYKKLQQKKNKLRNELNIKKNEPVILFVGKLIAKKNPLDLLKAFEKINNKKAHLIYVGSGKLDNKLKEYTNRNNLKNIHFVGFKNQTELPKYYTMADVFVLPSGMGETWGLVVNEAMNFQLPVIVSKTAGSSYDLVKENKNGFGFKEGNIDELSEKLKILVEDKKKREKFGNKSFEVVKNYSYEKDVEGVLDTLDNL